MDRPRLTKDITIKDFKDFYWLKAELVQFCKEIGIAYSGGKIEIAQCIQTYLESGTIIKSNDQKRNKTTSKFNWNNEKLTSETRITDNYKNTENVRDFFKQQIGQNFKFKVQFMNWMKNNVGKTLGDAVEQYKLLNEVLSDKMKAKEIAPQFEYNTYIRDFLAQNKLLTKAHAIKCWNLKRRQRGTNKYEHDDIKKFL